MTIELLSMLGGSLLGFIFRYMAAQQEAAQETVRLSMQLQTAADASADSASARSGAWVRRLLSGAVLFGLILGPFILALLDRPVYVNDPKLWWDVLGLFSGGYERIEGFVILPEVRTALLSVVGFYLGSAQVGRR